MGYGANILTILTHAQGCAGVLQKTITILCNSGETIRVNHDSDLALIARDFGGHRRPNLTEIGPYPPPEISDEERMLLAKRKRHQEVQ